MLAIQFDSKSKIKTVEEAILVHLEMENDAGSCRRCKCKQINTEYISKPSEMFIVQLNRNDDDGKKVNKAIDFEGHVKIKGEHLDPRIESSSNQSIQYELTAVIMHSGASVERGHYTIITKGRTGKWTLIDDETVTPIAIGEFCKLPRTQKDAYIFVYTRCPRQPTEERMIRHQRIYTVDRIGKRLQRKITSAPNNNLDWSSVNRQPESQPKTGLFGQIDLTSSPSVLSISSNTNSSKSRTIQAASIARRGTATMQPPPPPPFYTVPPSLAGSTSEKELKGTPMAEENFQMPAHCGPEFSAPQNNKKGFLRVQYIEYEASSQNKPGEILYEIPLDFAVRGYPINVKENPMETPLNSTLNTIIKGQKSNDEITISDSD